MLTEYTLQPKSATEIGWLVHRILKNRIRVLGCLKYNTNVMPCTSLFKLLAFMEDFVIFVFVYKCSSQTVLCYSYIYDMVFIT